MKRILTLLFLLFLFSCTSTTVKEVGNIKIKSAPPPSPLLLSWEKWNRDGYFILTFTKDKCRISIPQYNITKDFDIVYGKGKLLISVNLGEYRFSHISKADAAHNFFVYDLLNKISLEKVYVDNDTHIGHFVYEFKVEGDYLYINPNSSKLTAFRRY